MFHVKQIDDYTRNLPFINAELFHVKQIDQYGISEVRGSMFHVKHLHTQVTSKICFLYIKKSAEALYEGNLFNIYFLELRVNSNWNDQIIEAFRLHGAKHAGTDARRKVHIDFFIWNAL